MIISMVDLGCDRCSCIVPIQDRPPFPSARLAVLFSNDVFSQMCVDMA